MSNVDINVTVGANKGTSDYKTIVLKSNHSFAQQVTSPNVKYVVKYNYDLGGTSFTMPYDCILEFDGGVITNGTINCRNTRLTGNLNKSIDGIAVFSGTYNDYTNDTLYDKEYDSEVYSGLGRKIIGKNIVNGKNILTQAMLADENTIYIIQYDFTLGEDITIPENCVLEFDGGSISDHNILGNNVSVISKNKHIFRNCKCKSSYLELHWFYNDEGNELYTALDSLSDGGVLYIPEGEYYVHGIHYIEKEVHIKGDGENSIIIIDQRKTIAIQLFNNNCSIENLYFKNITDQTGFYNDEIWHQNDDVAIMILSSNNRVRNCKFTNFRYAIFVGSDYWNTLGENNKIENIKLDLCETCIVYRFQKNLIIDNVSGTYCYFGTSEHIIYGTYSEEYKSENVIIRNITAFLSDSFQACVQVKGTNKLYINNVISYGHSLFNIDNCNDVHITGACLYNGDNNQNGCIRFYINNADDSFNKDVYIDNVYIESVNPQINIKRYENVNLNNLVLVNTDEIPSSDYIIFNTRNSCINNVKFKSLYENNRITIDVLGGYGNKITNISSDINCNGRIAAGNATDIVIINSDIIKNPTISGGLQSAPYFINNAVKLNEIELGNDVTVPLYLSSDISPKKINVGDLVKDIRIEIESGNLIPKGKRIFEIKSDHTFFVKLYGIASYMVDYSDRLFSAGTYIIVVDYDGNQINIDSKAISSFNTFSNFENCRSDSVLQEGKIYYDINKKTYLKYDATLGEARNLDGTSLAAFKNDDRPSNVENGFFFIHGNNLEVFNNFWIPLLKDIYAAKEGTTTNRPTNVNIGFAYFDTTLSKPIYWNGTAWVDATGTTV